jgi:Domain of Unknown Function (DUF748)
MKAVRRLAIVAAIIVALCILVRLVLDPIAAHETRHALAGLDGYRGEFSDVHVTLFPPSYTIQRLALWQSPGGTRDEPIFFVERARAALSGSDLFHRRLVADLRLERPKISIIERVPSPKTEKPAAPAPDLSRALTQTLPFRVARVEVLGGEVLFRDDTAPLHPEVWVHALDLAGENLATRDALDGGRPARVSAHGTLGRSGEVEIYVSADALASPLAFAGRLSVRKFRAAELYAFLEPKAHVQTPQGTIDVFAQFVSRGGALTGGVKAVLANIDVRPTSDGLWDRLRAWLGDKAVKIASDRVPGRNAIATTVPIKGALTDPEVQLWPTVLGVVRNAFVAGLASGFSNLPPPTAPAPEGKLAQAKKALTKSAGPPVAEPRAGARPAGGPHGADARAASTPTSPSTKGH